MANRHPVTGFEPGRPQTAGHPRRTVPQLPVSQSLPAQFDDGLAVRARVHVLGEHVQQGGRDVVIVRNAVAAEGNPVRGKGLPSRGISTISAMAVAPSAARSSMPLTP